jgi:hypothetical protein
VALAEAGVHARRRRQRILKAGDPIVVKYSRYLPDALTAEVWLAVALMALGIVSIWLTEKLATRGEAPS